MPFNAATIFLPVLFPGILIMREERKIEKRDNLYGAFIRSLGRSSEVSGTTMVEGVRKLAMHKFGPLTPMITNLSRRLAMHINVAESWRHFAAETSSNLIDKFGEMYVLCIQNGSKPEETSIFISNNMFKVLDHPEEAADSIASSFVGRPLWHHGIPVRHPLHHHRDRAVHGHHDERDWPSRTPTLFPEVSSPPSSPHRTPPQASS